MRNAAKTKPRTVIRTPKSLKPRSAAPELAITRDVSLPEKVEKLLLTGDLKDLAVEDRLIYVNKLCKSLGLNPLTQPFQYLVLQGRMVLYATRTCTEQLRKIHGVSVTQERRKIEGEHCIVDVEVQDRTGRLDTGTGVVWVGNMKGNDYANALMKASTKAKRRATLSIVGLGFLDESELDTLQGKFKMVTPGGRIMSEPPRNERGEIDVDKLEEESNPYLQRYKEREKKELDKLTPEQREVVERKMKGGDATRQPVEHAVPNTSVTTIPAQDSSSSGGSHPAEQHAPCLFYQYFPESETYRITGDDELRKQNIDLLKPLLNPTARAYVATPSDLGRLISQFEQRGVPFRAIEKSSS